VDLLCDKLSNLLYDLLFVLRLVVDFCCGFAVRKWSIGIGYATLHRCVVDLSYSLLYKLFLLITCTNAYLYCELFDDVLCWNISNETICFVCFRFFFRYYFHCINLQFLQYAVL